MLNLLGIIFDSTLSNLNLLFNEIAQANLKVYNTKAGNELGIMNYSGFVIIIFATMAVSLSET